MSFGSALSGIGAALAGGANVLGALRGGQSAEYPKLDPFKRPLSTGSYWFGGGQLRSTTGDVLSQERDLRGRLGDLAKTVAPGMSQQRQALSGLFGAGRQQAMGTLRANLQQRGLLGASFANDQLAQLDAEFRLQEALAISQTYQSEFNNTLATLQAEGALKEQQAARELAELGITTDFLKDVNQVRDEQSKLLAELAGEQALRTAGIDPDTIDLPPPPPTKSRTGTPRQRREEGVGGGSGGSARDAERAARDRSGSQFSGRDRSNFGH